MNNPNFDEDKAAIQMDEVGWKVVAPDGRTLHKLDINQAVGALMSWNYHYWYSQNWWGEKLEKRNEPR